MSIAGYKRLTVILSILSCGLLLALGLVLHKYTWLKSDIRFAGEVTRSIREEVRFAIKNGVTAAADELQRLNVPEEARHPENPAMDSIELERSRAFSDLIGFLRRETGKDLGDSPDPWIEAFASK